MRPPAATPTGDATASLIAFEIAGIVALGYLGWLWTHVADTSTWLYSGGFLVEATGRRRTHRRRHPAVLADPRAAALHRAAPRHRTDLVRRLPVALARVRVPDTGAYRPGRRPAPRPPACGHLRPRAGLVPSGRAADPPPHLGPAPHDRAHIVPRRDGVRHARRGGRVIAGSTRVHGQRSRARRRASRRPRPPSPVPIRSSCPGCSSPATRWHSRLDTGSTRSRTRGACRCAPRPPSGVASLAGRRTATATTWRRTRSAAAGRCVGARPSTSTNRRSRSCWSAPGTSWIIGSTATSCRSGTDAWVVYMTHQLDTATDVLERAGARVVLLTSPCFGQPDSGLDGIPERSDPARLRAMNDVLRTYAKAHSARVSLVDLHAFLCPEGRVHADRRRRECARPGRDALVTRRVEARVAVARPAAQGRGPAPEPMTGRSTYGRTGRSRRRPSEDGCARSSRRRERARASRCHRDRRRPGERSRARGPNRASRVRPGAR